MVKGEVFIEVFKILQTVCEREPALRIQKFFSLSELLIYFKQSSQKANIQWHSGR